jgi:hypothetical protein
VAWVEVELGERGVLAGQSLYVIIRQMRPGWLSVLAAKLHRPEEFSDDAAKMLWGQATGSWPEIYEIEKAFQKLGARSRQAVRS